MNFACQPNFRREDTCATKRRIDRAGDEAENGSPRWERFGATGMKIHGACHCGNISFDLDWQPEPTEIPARACLCSFCRKHGGLWTSNPAATLEVRIADPSHASRYEFGTRTAQFHICTRCGAVPVVTSRIEGKLYAVVSVNAFEGMDPSMLRPGPASFEGEEEATRLARRKRNWIGDVRFDGESA